MSDLATYLQRRFDAERAAIANELHDALGGLLVAAKIDVGLLELALPDRPDAVRTRLTKLKESLDNALSVERRLAEQLYPSLLVHVGLVPALRCYAEQVCGRAGRPWSVNLPTGEPRLPHDTAIALYRVAQEALLGVLAATSESPIEIDVLARDGTLTMRISSAGSGAVAEAGGSTTTSDYALLSMHHRTESIGGQLNREILPRGGIAFTVELKPAPQR